MGLDKIYAISRYTAYFIVVIYVMYDNAQFYASVSLGLGELCDNISNPHIKTDVLTTPGPPLW